MTDRTVPAREVQARALSGSVWGLASALCGLPLTIASTVVLARVLGAAGFGQYALYAFVVATVIGLSDLGFTSGQVQRGAAAFGRGDAEALGKMSGQALTWSLLRWPLLFCAFALYLHDVVATVALIVVAGFAVACSGVSLVLVCSIRNAELSRLSFVAGTLSAAATITACLGGAPPARILAFGLATQYSANALQLLYLRRDRPAWRHAFRPRSLTDARSDFTFGFTTYMSAQMATLTLSRSELLFFAPAQEVARGVFAAAYTVSSRLTLPIDAMYGALGASLSAVDATDDASRGMARALRLSGTLFSLLAGPGVLLALVAADVLFPAAYTGIGRACVVLATTSLLVSSANPIIASYYARRRLRPLLRGSALALLVNVALSLLLISPFGLVGAVVANAASAVVYAAALTVPMLRAAGPPRAAILGYLGVVGPALLLAAALGLAVSTIDADGVRWLCAGILAILQPLVVLRLFPSLDTGDVDALARLLPRRLTVACSPVRRLVVRER